MRTTREDPDGLAPEELEIVRNWTKSVAGTFYIYRFLKQYTVFLSETEVYAVLGLHDPLSHIYRDWDLPVMAEGVILPYKGKIVYDGILQTYRIHFGAGIRGNLHEQYMKAKQNGRIIFSLAPEVLTLAPAGRQLDKKRARQRRNRLSLRRRAFAAAVPFRRLSSSW